VGFNTVRAVPAGRGKGRAKKVGHLGAEELAARTMRAPLVHTIAFGVCVALLTACSLSEEADGARRWLNRIWPGSPREARRPLTKQSGSPSEARRPLTKQSGSPRENAPIAAFRSGGDPVPVARLADPVPAWMPRR
jgi:hypothetical protein